MPGDLQPPKAGQKTFDRLQTAPKADQIPEGLKTPKRQHSSRFDISEKRELEKLPAFHGTIRSQDLIVRRTDYRKQRFRPSAGKNCSWRNWSNAM